MIYECKSPAGFEQLLENSRIKPVFLIKHSTHCPYSAFAWQHFVKFSQTTQQAEFWKLLVIENRAVSQLVAEKTGIVHESPQVIMFTGRQAVKSWAHSQIKENHFEKALLDLLAEK